MTPIARTLDRIRPARRSMVAAAVSVAVLLGGVVPGQVLAQTATPSPTATPAVQTLSLRKGWNLVAFNVQPADRAPGAVFAPLVEASTLDAVWTYGPTFTCISGRVAAPCAALGDDRTCDSTPGANDGACGASSLKQWTRYPAPTADVPGISAIAPGRGYWVKVKSTTSLSVVGSASALPVAPPDLTAGWNLVGFTNDTSRRYSDVLDPSVGDGRIDQIWTFDAQAGAFKGVVLPATGVGTPSKEEFTTIEPGRAYWVKADAAVSLTPSLGMSLPGDVDVEPLLDLTSVPFGQSIPWPAGSRSPGDQDIGGDGNYDPPQTQRYLDFGTAVEVQPISISNKGDGVLNWSVSIENPDTYPWLRLRTIDPDTGKDVLWTRLSGSVGTDSVTVDVLVDRTGLAAGSYGSRTTPLIRVKTNGVSSNAPERDVYVSMSVPDLEGDYRVTARIATINGKPADIANPRLVLSMYRDGSRMKAIVNDEQTLLLPAKVRMDGTSYESGTNRIVLNGSLTLKATNPDNPFDTELRRDITLLADRRQRGNAADAALGPLDLKGEYYETILNVLAQPIQLVGTFTAEYLGETPSTRDIGTNTNTQAGSIPDEGQGTLVRTFAITDRIRMSEVSFVLNLEHTRPSDLSISLQSPTGKTILLRDRSSDPVGERTYDRTLVPDLDRLKGDLSEGTWTLSVRDLASGDLGRFVGGRLDIKGTRVNRLAGKVVGVPVGSLVILTGCGQTRSAFTAADGGFAFTELIDCAYRVTVYAAGFTNASVDVALNGEDQINLSLAPEPTTDPSPIPVVLPSTSGCSTNCFVIKALTNHAFAGNLDRTALQYGMDTATFDLNRQPLTLGNEDSDYFTGEENTATGTNKCVTPAVFETGKPGQCGNLGNGTLDSAIGKNRHRIVAAVGNPVIGLSVGGSERLAIGAQPGLVP